METHMNPGGPKPSTRSDQNKASVRRAGALVDHGMDRERTRRGLLGFRSRKVEPNLKRECAPPISPASPRKTKLQQKKSSSQKLPPKYAILEAFYEGLEAAIGLLGIRRQLSTFRAVCSTVEATTKRRFLHSHLAQIRHILPEAVQLEYVRCADPDTLRKRWDLHISLLPMPADEEMELAKGESSTWKESNKTSKVETVQRRQAFHARLLEFASTHPKLDDIPEALMPQRPSSSCPTSKVIDTKTPAISPLTANFATNSVDKSPGSSSQANKHASPSECQMPAAITSLPLAIVTSPDLEDSAKCEIPVGTPHLPPPFRPYFSVKPRHSVNLVEFPLPENPDENFLEPPLAGKLAESSGSDLLGTVIPLPINRFIHRDVHATTKIPEGTPHFPSSFRSFFSATVASTGATHQISPLPSTPVRSSHPENYSTSPCASSPARLSATIASTSATLNTTPLPHTPARSSHPEMFVKSPCVNTPAQTSGMTINGSPVACIPMNTPPSLDPSNPLYCHSLGQTSVSAKLPLATPVKQPTTIRSLQFKTPMKSPLSEVAGTRTPGAGSNGKTPKSSVLTMPTHFTTPSQSPSFSFASTPCLQTPASPPRPSRPKDGHPAKRTKLNLGPLFAKETEDEACLSGDSLTESAELECPDEETTTSNQEAAVGRASLHKSKHFAHTAIAEIPGTVDLQSVSEADRDIIQCLPPELVQSVIDEEKRALMESSKETVKLRKRQQLLAGLPQLFNQLRLIFQSCNRSVLSYKELLSKILTGSADMTDRGEVEERLKLLTELAPNWISVKPSLSGDRLYRINRNIDAMGVRKKLLGVK